MLNDRLSDLQPHPPSETCGFNKDIVVSGASSCWRGEDMVRKLIGRSTAIYFVLSALLLIAQIVDLIPIVKELAWAALHWQKISYDFWSVVYRSFSQFVWLPPLTLVVTTALSFYGLIFLATLSEMWSRRGRPYWRIRSTLLAMLIIASFFSLGLSEEIGLKNSAIFALGLIGSFLWVGMLLALENWNVLLARESAILIRLRQPEELTRVSPSRH